MSSFGSWCDSFSNMDTEDDEWSHVSKQESNSQIASKNEEPIENKGEYSDHFEHLTNESVTEKWSSIHENDFDVQSIPSMLSSTSIGSGQPHFIFTDYHFKNKPKSIAKKIQQKAKWVVIKPSKHSRRSSRRNKNRLLSSDISHSLCVIDENGEMVGSPTADFKQEEAEKTVLGIGDLKGFIHDIVHSKTDHMNDIILLCNRITKKGILTVNDTKIELREHPLIVMKLRDVLFQKLILLKCIDSNGLTESNKHALRCQIWLQLSWNSRVFLTPFGSFEEFRSLYDIHRSVRVNEMLSVIDNESFMILKKPEWTRAVLFKSYLMKVQSLQQIEKKMIALEKAEEINEMRSVVQSNFGGFSEENYMRNLQQFQEQQYAMFGSSYDYTVYSHGSFDELERRIELECKLNLIESF